MSETIPSSEDHITCQKKALQSSVPILRNMFCIQYLAGTEKPEPICRTLKGPSPTVNSTPQRGGEGDVEDSGARPRCWGGSCLRFGLSPLTHFPTSSTSHEFPSARSSLASRSRLMVWTQTCWQTGCKEDVWGKARQKFGVQDRSAVWLRMTTLCSNKYGRSMGNVLMVKTSCCRNCSSYLTLSELQSSLSFTLSICLGALRGGKANSQGLKVCEKTWLDRGSRCHGIEVGFRHEALFVLISKPVRRPFDVVFGWCPQASCLC